MTTLHTDPDGYSITICSCDGGPYIGARKSATPDCCERCGFMTREQFDAILQAILAPIRSLVDEVTNRYAIALADPAQAPKLAGVPMLLELRELRAKLEEAEQR